MRARPVMRTGAYVGWQMIVEAAIPWVPRPVGGARVLARDELLQQVAASWPLGYAHYGKEGPCSSAREQVQRCLLARGSWRRAAGKPLGGPRLDTPMQMHDVPLPTYVVAPTFMPRHP